MTHASYYPLLAFLLTGMVLSIWHKKLTLPAALTGGLCGLLVFAGAGFTGIAIMASFFIVGTLATGWQMTKKENINVSTKSDRQRKVSQVIANAGIAAIAGGLTIVFPSYFNLWGLVIAASFSSATADTLASELGTIYGKRFYNILTWKPDQRGLDGVVSLEGTLIGVAGSALIAAIYIIGYGFSNHFFVLILAGTIGNLTDSILGAALERKGILKNDGVNFLNTLVAALVAACFM